MQEMTLNNNSPASWQEPVSTLLSQMTLTEKIGQMTQAEKNSIPPQDVTHYAIGSVLSGGGGNPIPNNPHTWTAMVRSFQDAALQTRLGIPLIYGVDAVHGHSNVKGAVIFPHNIGLGATRDAELVDKIAYITASELLAMGIPWNFAPAVSVPQDIRWGRTYEGFSDDTELVALLGQAYVRGLQRQRSDGLWVMATPKHFVGDGGTGWKTTQNIDWITQGNWQAATLDYKIDQGDTILDEDTLRKRHLYPYTSAIAEGALSIMVSFSSWNGDKLHGHRYLLSEVLKGELGFEGFLVSDWMAVDQLDADFYTCVVQAINAGLDMVMVPYDYKGFISTLTMAVQKGDVAQERIDDAVSRILRAKHELGLFERPFGDNNLLSQVGSVAHRNVAREAASKSCVLLKNEGHLLPLAKDIPQLLIAGPAADDIGLQCGGWSIDWQGGSGTTTDGTTILAGIRELISPSTEVHYNKAGEFSADVQVEVGIVVLGEEPYAEGVGDKGDLRLIPEDIGLLERVRQHCQHLIVILVSGRPLIITDQLPLMDALIAAWLPGTEGHGVADVLLADQPFSGKLSLRWPASMDQLPLSESDEPLFPFGFGLETTASQ